jgi:predicted nucleic acid-binding protein
VSRVFLDTSGWFAALFPREAGHKEALTAYQRAADDTPGFLTTTLVLGEMHALMLRARGPRDAGRFADAVLASRSIAVVSPGVELIAAALDRWIHGFRDQEFSLCDAVSFEVMRRERSVDALARDRHFKVAGFNLLR